MHDMNNVVVNEYCNDNMKSVVAMAATAATAQSRYYIMINYATTLNDHVHILIHLHMYDTINC